VCNAQNLAFCRRAASEKKVQTIGLLAAAQMSERGQTETSARSPGMSVPPPLADIIRLQAQVRFVPNPDMAS
jgi:hypothetical protein